MTAQPDMTPTLQDQLAAKEMTVALLNKSGWTGTGAPSGTQVGEWIGDVYTAILRKVRSASQLP